MSHYLRNLPQITLTHKSSNFIQEIAMPQFTKGELEIMRILWKHGELKPADIQDQYPCSVMLINHGWPKRVDLHIVRDVLAGSRRKLV